MKHISILKKYIREFGVYKGFRFWRFFNQIMSLPRNVQCSVIAGIYAKCDELELGMSIYEIQEREILETFVTDLHAARTIKYQTQ